MPQLRFHSSRNAAGVAFTLYTTVCLLKEEFEPPTKFVTPPKLTITISNNVKRYLSAPWIVALPGPRPRWHTKSWM